MLKFNHNSSTIGEAMGIERSQEGRLLGNMFFEIIQRDFVMQDLYDNPDEAPIELRTTSGLLESILKDCNAENERAFIIWEFSKTDFLRSENNRNLEKMLSAVAMIFMMSDKKKDKFIERFIDFHRKASNHIDD